MINRIGSAAQHIANRFIGLDAARQQILAAHFRKRRRLENTLGKAKSFDHRFKIFDGIKEPRVDQRRRGRIRALQRDETATLRAQQANMAGKAVAETAAAAVIEYLTDDEMQLNVGDFRPWARLQKAARFGEIRSNHAAAVLPVAANFA